MRKPRDVNKFDMKEVVDLVRGFNNSILRISAIQNRRERRVEIGGLGKRLIDLGRKIKKVKLAEL